jgi:hypothetical protein
VPLISQERIGQDDELSHDRRQGDLGRLSCREQGLVLGFQIRIEAGCYQRRHVQSLTHMSATTADRATAARGSTLAGHRSQAGEAGHLALIEAAEFRHVGEQAHGGGLSNAGNAHKNRQTAGKSRILQAQALKLCVDGCQMASDLALNKAERTIFCRLSAAVRSLISAYRATRSSFIASRVELSTGRIGGSSRAPKRASRAASSRSVLVS